MEICKYNNNNNNNNNNMKSPSWEANSRSASQETPGILWNPKVQSPSWQEPTSGPSPESDECSPQHTIPLP